MSFICTKTDEPYAKRYQTLSLVWVKFDPTSAKEPLPFPSDYKYFSCLMPSKYALWADRIYNFKVRPDDIWVLAFGKSGTTWMRNIVHQLKVKNLDFTAEYVQPDSNYLDLAALFERIDGNEELTKFVEMTEKSFDEFDALPSPRMIKSHLPAHLLPKELWTVRPKIIYTSREAKDVAISLFHMYRNHLLPYTGTMAEFFYDFSNDCALFGPFYEHINSFHQLRHFKNILFMTYEEMIVNTFGNVKRVNDFLECSYSDEQLKQLIEHVSFGKMREKIGIISNKSSDPAFKFCRRGKVGGYRDEMSEDEVKRFDEWSAKKKSELNLI